MAASQRHLVSDGRDIPSYGDGQEAFFIGWPQQFLAILLLASAELACKVSAKHVRWYAAQKTKQTT